ncbi:MAG: helix-turn-helix domain-containing protein [Acidimicrobiales bacterium]
MSKRRAIVLSVVLEGLSQAETARRFGVSEAWVSVLLARYRDEGDAAFVPRSRRPKRSPSRIGQPTVVLIIALRDELVGQGLDAGPETIRWHLQQRHQVTVPVACSPYAGPGLCGLGGFGLLVSAFVFVGGDVAQR